MADTLTTTTCSGRVTRIATVTNVPTDSQPGRTVTVELTRCSDCAGSAYVTDDDGLRRSAWAAIQLPADYRTDDEMAAYWAAEVSVSRAPTHVVEHYPVVEVFADDDGFDDYFPIEDEDGSVAFARSLEARAERGTWFGSDPF